MGDYRISIQGKTDDVEMLLSAIRMVSIVGLKSVDALCKDDLTSAKKMLREGMDGDGASSFQVACGRVATVLVSPRAGPRSTKMS